MEINDVAETRSFPLKNAGSWISFAPFKKHRLTGLRMPGSTWKIFFGDLTVDEWENGGSSSLIVE